MTGVDFRNTQLTSQALYHPGFEFGPDAALPLSPEHWTSYLLGIGFPEDTVRLLVQNTNISRGVVPIEILYEDRITCQNPESTSASWRTICNKMKNSFPEVKYFVKVILTFQKCARELWGTMQKLDPAPSQDQPLRATLHKIIEEAAWDETRLEITRRCDNPFAWNQVQRSHTISSDLMPSDELLLVGGSVPQMNDQDEDGDISDISGINEALGMANWENLQQDERTEEQVVASVEEGRVQQLIASENQQNETPPVEEERGQQLIANVNQQQDERTEGQVVADKKVGQPEDEQDNKDTKLPWAITNEGKTQNYSRDDLSPTSKKAKIPQAGDDKGVVLSTPASAFPLQNAAAAAAVEEERGQQLIANVNQQQDERTEGQVVADKKVGQPEDEQDNKDTKLPWAITNEGKTHNYSQDDLSPTSKKAKIPQAGDDKGVVLSTPASAFPLQNAASEQDNKDTKLPWAITNEGKTHNYSQDDLSPTSKKAKIPQAGDDKGVVLPTPASAFPLQNAAAAADAAAAQSIVLMSVQVPMLTGLANGFPLYVLQGNSTSTPANQDFVSPASNQNAGTAQCSFVTKSILKRPGS